MHKQLTTILLLLSSSINANFNTDYTERINSKSNLENLLPQESQINITQENSEFKEKYQIYFINCVKKTYWNEQEAIETLDAFKPGVAIITETLNDKRLFIDGFGKGTYDGIIDVYSERNMVLEADGLERDYKDYFGEGLSNTENYFLEDLKSFQKHVFKLLKSKTEAKTIFSQENDEDLEEQEYLLKMNNYLILVSPNTMTINYKDNATYINYNPIEILEIHKEIYSAVKQIYKESN
ncbi:MAG: hypothetical protein PHU51_02880 [Candidatus Nanoarchaeia archaeon]|nr:hypothetical protein [Candidatus Nanoarchaeia archaeon]